MRDPGNVGTVIRTAAALGVERVVLSRDCADVLACKTVRASMGAVLCADILLTADLAAEVCAIIKSGGAVYAAMLSGDAVTLSADSLPADFSVVIGNEGQGVRPGRCRGMHRLCAHSADRPCREPQCSRCCRDFYVGDEKNG